MTDKGYNLRQLEELAGGSDEFVNSMVETFLEHTPGQLKEMLDAYKNGDLTVMGGVAHKIKPNIDLFEIEAIREEVRTIESHGKTGVMDSELERSVKKVETVLQNIFDQLKAR